jgi:hypothetical protein
MHDVYKCYIEYCSLSERQSADSQLLCQILRFVRFNIRHSYAFALLPSLATGCQYCNGLVITPI